MIRGFSIQGRLRAQLSALSNTLTYFRQWTTGNPFFHSNGQYEDTESPQRLALSLEADFNELIWLIKRNERAPSRKRLSQEPGSDLSSVSLLLFLCLLRGRDSPIVHPPQNGQV